jgi:hypothetical protein
MAPPPKQKNHTFKYVKINDFKTVQIHGAYGGVNLRGQLNMNFYVECPDLPKTTQSLILGNTLGPEIIPGSIAMTKESSWSVYSKETCKFLSAL